MIKIVEEKGFTNGSLKDFDPFDLMNKVATTGKSLHTDREYGDYVYTIFIQYKNLFGGRGADNSDELYHIDIIREDENGEQERLVMKMNLTAKDVVKYLNQWKEKIINK